MSQKTIFRILVRGGFLKLNHLYNHRRIFSSYIGCFKKGFCFSLVYAVTCQCCLSDLLLAIGDFTCQIHVLSLQQAILAERGLEFNFGSSFAYLIMPCLPSCLSGAQVCACVFLQCFCFTQICVFELFPMVTLRILYILKKIIQILKFDFPKKKINIFLEKFIE